MPTPKTTKKPERQTREAEPLFMRASVVPSTIDEAARTVDVTWSTGSDVDRRDWWTGERFVESLSMNPKHIRMGRLNGGAPVLDSHSSYSTRSVLGVVESARIEDGKGIATLRFSSRAEVEPVWQDVRNGILRSISVGYAVHKWDVKRNADGKLEKRTAVDWEPHELSIVPIPADPGAQIRAYEDDTQQETEDMTQKAEQTPPGNEERAQTPPAPVAASPSGPTADEIRAQERQRTTSIDELCRIHGVAAEKRSKFLADGSSVDAVRAAILEDIGAQQRATHITPGNGQREQDMVRSAADATLERLGYKVEGEGYRDFAGNELSRIAARILEAGGVNTRNLSNLEIAKRAISTSDFATFLNLVGKKVTRDAYDATELTHRIIFRRTTSSDFKDKHSIQIAGGVAMPKVVEGGPFTRTAPVAASTKYKLATYGEITTFTRQMLVNDDIGLFQRSLQMRSRAAAETERKVVWDLILSNPDAEDGVAVFHTDHGNYGSGAGSAVVAAANLAAARQALRTAEDAKGNRINAQMKHLVIGADTENAWEVLLAGQYMPTSTSGVLAPSLRGLKPIVESAITDNSFYGFADHNAIDTVEYAYLQGQEGVRLEQRYNFDTDGVDIKTALDFGAGIIDHRGMYWHEQTS